MADIIRKDESVLNTSERYLLKKTLDILELFFPEHKVFAFDALCPTQRKDSSTLSKTLGYESSEEFLNAYGYEVVSGPKVYEMRKDCGIKPGKEPEYIKGRIDAAIHNLNEYYPDHAIDSSIHKEHKRLASNLTGLWQWLGYKSLGDMLTAYGFTYSINENASKGGRPSDDQEAIISELISRYKDADKFVYSIDELKEENPDLAPKFKNLQNKAKDLFGMSFVKYLKEKGVIFTKKEKTSEEIEAEKKAESLECLNEFDKLFQKEFAGWKPLPVNATELIYELDNTTSKKKLRRALESLDVNPDEHFAELNVIATEETDNELRKLIQHINFEVLIKDAGLKPSGAGNVEIKDCSSTESELSLSKSIVDENNKEESASDKPQNVQNWDKANSDRSSSASNEQINWIKTIIKDELGRDVSPYDSDVELGLKSLPQNLKEVALLRLKNPEANLTEIGQMLTVPVGKAGVYKRLEKIHDLAIEIKHRNKESS